MKTAVSLPDDLFQDAERLVRRRKTSRSSVYADALREYVARHDPEAITEAYNRVIEELGQPHDPAFSAASARTLLRSEW
jgi:metal-responsive CopG/Arc/MetJ family transcriptional regulator